MNSKPSLAEKLSTHIYRTIDRRAFFRKSAGATFKTVAVLAAGGALATAVATPAWADCGGCAGSGCPTVIDYRGRRVSKGCGPSRCCNYTSGMNSGCNCWTGSGCKRNSYCGGATGYCWSCAVVTLIAPNGCQYGYVTTCCDCNTHCYAADCGGGHDYICIGVASSVYKKFGC
jgi:hypothetical protein